MPPNQDRIRRPGFALAKSQFSVGAASDQHAGGSPGHNPEHLRFHRVGGGFLSVQVKRKDGASHITFRHHDTTGAVRYEFQKQRTI
jgi:hypothetical protein